jgi:hypothetical protein
MLRTIVAVVAVVGMITLIYLPFGSAQQGDNIEQKIREAKTAADHQAIAAYYETEAHAAHAKYDQHLGMAKSYGTTPTLKEKSGAVTHCETIAKKYQEIAKEYEAMAAIHKTMAGQAK